MSSYLENTGGNGLNFKFNFKDAKERGGFFNRTLLNLSSIGKNNSDTIIRNAVLRASNEPKEEYGNEFDLFNQKVIADTLNKKYIPAFDPSSSYKREILRQYAKKSEIIDVLEKIAYETIIFDDKNRYCNATDINGNFSKKVKERLPNVFEKIYTYFNFDDNITVINYFLQFLVDGTKAFEIVYDDREQNIIGIRDIDTASIEPALDPISGKRIWIQDKSDAGKRKIILDTHIIFISWSNANSLGGMSYLERIIRPFNLMRTLEDARVVYDVSHAGIHRQFKINTTGKPAIKARESLGVAMNMYKESLQFDSENGLAVVNGSANIPYYKDYWWIKNELGESEVSILDTGSSDITQIPIIKYMEKKFNKMTKIPLGRFNEESGGGVIFANDTDVTRDELEFSRFIGIIRTIWKEILVKPLWIQMCLEFPELQNDIFFKKQINIKYVEDNIFQKWKEINNLNKTVEVINKMLEIPKGKEDSFFPIITLLKEHLGLTDAKIEEMKKLKAEEIKEMNGETGEGTEPTFDEPTGGGGDIGSGEPTSEEPSAPEPDAPEVDASMGSGDFTSDEPTITP